MPFSRELAKILGQKCTTRLSKLATLWSSMWGCPSLFDETSVNLNRRLRRTVARHQRAHGTIELGPIFLQLRARRPEVLCHELAHAAVHFKFASGKKPHSREWKNFVTQAGFAASTRMEVASTARSRQLNLLYRHRCPVCQMQRLARRPVRAWRCAACLASGLDGILYIERLG